MAILIRLSQVANTECGSHTSTSLLREAVIVGSAPGNSSSMTEFTSSQAALRAHSDPDSAICFRYGCASAGIILQQISQNARPGRKEHPLTKKLLTILTSAAYLSACGGGGGSNNNNAEVGYLTYTGIRGLSYETASQSGTTGDKGEYRYYPGETVTFRLGDMTLAEN